MATYWSSTAAAAWWYWNPTPRTCARTASACASPARTSAQLNRLRREPSRTLDGVDIKLWANAESRDDVAEAHALGAAGVGLYRTEFLFLQHQRTARRGQANSAPTATLVLGMTGRTVTIRTLDLGADKADNTGLALRNEPNPAMGLRGVRLSLAREGRCSHTQLRAIVRASGYGPCAILVPMVSGREEIFAVRDMLRAAMREVAQRRRRDGREYPPGRDDRSAVGGDRAADFIDACRLPVDRHQRPGAVPACRGPQQRCARRPLLAAAPGADAPAARCRAHRPMRRGKPVAVCGEIAGDAMFTPLLLALGLREFSLHPGTLLEVRRAIRGCDMAALQAEAPGLRRARDRAAIETWLRSVGVC